MQDVIRKSQLNANIFLKKGFNTTSHIFDVIELHSNLDQQDRCIQNVFVDKQSLISKLKAIPCM